jgi:hypothetical protein
MRELGVLERQATSMAHSSHGMCAAMAIALG